MIHQCVDRRNVNYCADTVRSDELTAGAAGVAWVGCYLFARTSCGDALWPGVVPAADAEHPEKLARPGSRSTTPNEESPAWSKQTERQHLSRRSPVSVQFPRCKQKTIMQLSKKMRGPIAGTICGRPPLQFQA